MASSLKDLVLQLEKLSGGRRLDLRRGVNEWINDYHSLLHSPYIVGGEDTPENSSDGVATSTTLRAQQTTGIVREMCHGFSSAISVKDRLKRYKTIYDTFFVLANTPKFFEALPQRCQSNNNVQKWLEVVRNMCREDQSPGPLDMQTQFIAFMELCSSFVDRVICTDKPVSEESVQHISELLFDVSSKLRDAVPAYLSCFIAQSKNIQWIRKNMDLNDQCVHDLINLPTIQKLKNDLLIPEYGKENVEFALSFNLRVLDTYFNALITQDLTRLKSSLEVYMTSSTDYKRRDENHKKSVLYLYAIVSITLKYYNTQTMLFAEKRKKEKEEQQTKTLETRRLSQRYWRH